jgi:hypothetical protein
MLHPSAIMDIAKSSCLKFSTASFDAANFPNIIGGSRPSHKPIMPYCSHLTSNFPNLIWS